MYDAWDASSDEETMALCYQALAIFPFSVDAYNCIGNLYQSSGQIDAIYKSQKAYEYALVCTRLQWPGIENQASIKWGYLEHRPFLRAYHRLGLVLYKQGKIEEALEKFRFLLKVNPNDNQGVRSLAFHIWIELKEFEKAEALATKHFNGREKSTECFIRYGFCLMDFLRSQYGYCDRKEAEESLLRALETNHYVIPMLFQDVSTQETISRGTQDEATDYVNLTKASWMRVDILSWLKQVRYRGGHIPPDDGTILFNLLSRGRILVCLNDGSFVEGTTNVERIPARALNTFILAPGMKCHNPSKLVCYQFHDGELIQPHFRDGGFIKNYTSFAYEYVQSIPFWSLLHSSERFGREREDPCCNVCDKSARFQCSVCKVTWYCSEACQKRDWKGRGQGALKVPHKVMCRKFVKT
jgi:hypothetical protein